MNTTPTSAETAEVTDKAKPAVKQTREDKVIAGMKDAWGKLKASDKQWEQTGRAFGKWCSELRKLTKKQGSRKGLGFEAIVKNHAVDFQKARYWADVVDGKTKPRYAGGSKVKPKTNDKDRGDGFKPQPFVLVGLTDEQQDAMAQMETDAKGFAQFAYKAITNPGAEQVRFVVDRCLDKLDKLQDQLDLLADLRGWIDRQCFELQDQVEAGHTTVQERRGKGRTPRLSLKVSFLDADDEGTDVSPLINKARESRVNADENTNAPEPNVPAELVVPQQEAANAVAGGM